jgi:hypothetical protein
MRSKVLATAVVIVATVGLWATPAQADDTVPGGFGSWEELFETQQKLIAAADVVHDVALGTPETGFAGFSVKPENREVRLWWRGELPANVAAAVERARTIAPVSVLPARHSKAELDGVADRVAGIDGVTAVGPLSDGSGLRVSTVDERVLDAVRAVTGGLALTTDRMRPALASRQAPTSPQYGGSAFTKPLGNGTSSYCTTGFTITNPRAGSRLLTAGHCGDLYDQVYAGTGPTIMGTVTSDNNTKDTMIISVGGSAGRIYVDGYNSNTSKPVKTAFNSYEDTLVCTSGAMTGEHCKIRITNTGMTINVGYLIHPVVMAEHDDDLAAVGEGDSGGPVVSQDSGGFMGKGDFVLVYAQGTITALDLNAEVPCASMYPTTCSSTMFYVDIMDSLAYYNSSIVTG